MFIRMYGSSSLAAKISYFMHIQSHLARDDLSRGILHLSEWLKSNTNNHKHRKIVSTHE